MLKSFLCDLVIVVLAFALSWFFIYDISSLSYFSPLEKSSDFETSDFYQLVSDSRAVRTLNDDIVVVSVDDLSRGEITDALEMISLCDPAAVGIDVLFGFPQEDDPRLVEVLSGMSNVVVPDTSAYIYSSCPGLIQGSVYLEADSYRSTVRECITDGTFTSRLAYLYRAGIELPERMRIEYPGVEFNVIHAAELPDVPELLEGKIVLVGVVNDFSDVHPTPVDDAMPGILIHASAIATMLSPDRVTDFPEWADWLVAIVLCYAFVSSTRILKRYDWGDLVMRVVQIAVLILIIIIGTEMYVARHIDINFSRPLVMIAAGTLAVDVWNGMDGLAGIFMRRIRIRRIGRFRKLILEKRNKPSAV